ncbi:MAG TPA: isoaspartyl peptidase/L-asparaginase [Solirubrobacteraceae bacterium]|nr:isoaspartyl peptidase/L-asparaginase [Solirubrobacteraceae bacterium]
MQAHDREPAGPPTILIHAGAGALGAELREHGPEAIDTLHEVLAAAGRRLQAGEEAAAVATAAVEGMEDCGLFNAGYGAALCSDGSVELSAALMRGRDRAAGGVAGLRRVRHPIRAAALVLETDQVLMIGERADQLALAQGAEAWENAAFVTDRQRARLLSPPAVTEDRGTVGAVCLDAQGNLAAATSTGGINGQPPGRVGDSPLIGSGTWADARVAISCTGDGEAFIRAGVARGIAARVAHGVPVEAAAQEALDEVGGLGGTGGLIALDRGGRLALPFSTEAMPRGIWRPGQTPDVRLD